MATKSSSDGENAVPVEYEKEGPTSVATQQIEAADIDAKDLPKGYFLKPYFVGTLLASGLSVSGGVGVLALVAPLLGIINNDIGPDPNYVWIALCIYLPCAIGQVLVGRLSGLFGRRCFFILGSLLALLGCVISAVATSINMLIGGTVLVGFAAASQLSYVFVVGELIPFKHRFISMTFLYSCAVPFSGFGPAMAYVFVQHTKHTWRSCYYLMIGVNSLAVICWVLFYFPPTSDEKYAHRKTKRQDPQDFEFIGLVLLVGGLLIFLMGISWGGSLYPWKSAHVIATIIVGFFTLVAFTLYEALVPLKEPLIPPYVPL